MAQSSMDSFVVGQAPKCPRVSTSERNSDSEEAELTASSKTQS